MFRRIIAALFVFIMVSSELVHVASAAPGVDESFYSSNDILFYDPRCETGVAQGLISLQGKDKVEKILKFFMDPARGLTLAQTAGIIGNLMAESKLDSSIIQGGGNANPDYKPVNSVGFGLAQWTFTSRQQPLVDYINANVPTKDITDFDGQVNFIWHELSGTHANALRKLKETTTALDATISFHTYYEGSADSAAQVQQVRGANAQKVYDEYKDKEALAGSTATGTDGRPLINSTSTVSPRVGRSCLPGAGGGDLINLTQQYAWPEYRRAGSAGATTPTDAYRDAVSRAQAAKRYVGGGPSYPGIDCGGFVTTLIVDSGFDKNYNYESLVSKGAGYTIKQEQWLKANWKTLDPTDATDRQPGDVAINDSHTYIFVGPDVFPDHYPIASASLNERSPMRGGESVVSTSHNYFRWYRKA
jgi:hypothetical protein